MRTVSIFMNNANQAIRIPKDMQFEGVTELEIQREGDTILLRPVRPSWTSFAGERAADAGFLTERPAVVQTGQFDLSASDDDAGAQSQ
ncbi:type II toxin-antitoxin system VapB family antitoxin [Caballeronia sp.]|uniref:type II toxin-antitoxin system VapB family antitoxin n=1 Tax=Caballeronia sp. TaxID=1931223 RepID=UPI0026092A52|nr:type II toxin-antitoxin system VapB family antitoxin [Caballeronia sp.]